MAPRASWIGHLKLSRINIPVRLYRAVSSSQSQITLRMLHQGCRERLHSRYVCPKHGVVERDEGVKGYEYGKDTYVVIDDDLLKGIKLETTKTIEVLHFVDASELDPLYLDTPYYLAPDGPIPEEAFRLLREGLRRSQKVAIGRVILGGREYGVAISPRDKGLLLFTLRYAKEVHTPAPYFESLEDKAVDRKPLALATQLIEGMEAPFAPVEFRDRYEEALTEAITAKIQGIAPKVIPKVEVEEVGGLMEALQRSVAEVLAGERVRKRPPATSIKPTRQARKKAHSG